MGRSIGCPCNTRVPFYSRPGSCEAGSCGNCAARCTQGHVWMALNDVLTDREMARGLVLTCTVYPVGTATVRLGY